MFVTKKNMKIKSPVSFTLLPSLGQYSRSVTLVNVRVMSQVKVNVLNATSQGQCIKHHKSRSMY